MSGEPGGIWVDGGAEGVSWPLKVRVVKLASESRKFPWKDDKPLCAGEITKKKVLSHHRATPRLAPAMSAPGEGAGGRARAGRLGLGGKERLQVNQSSFPSLVKPNERGSLDC